MKKVTVAAIAKEAGVSPGTVSNALNNRKGSISKEKRDHIIEVAEKLGYFKTGKGQVFDHLLFIVKKSELLVTHLFFLN